jgi:hypothetical protein
MTSRLTIPEDHVKNAIGLSLMNVSHEFDKHERRHNYRTKDPLSMLSTLKCKVYRKREENGRRTDFEYDNRNISLPCLVF